MYLSLFLLPGATPVPNPVNSNPPDLSWLGPTIGAIGLAIVALIGVGSMLLGKRADRKNAQAAAQTSAEPKVVDGWEEVRAARAEASKYYNLYRIFEDAYYTVSAALRHLARVVHSDHPEMVLDKDVTDAIAFVPPDTSDVTK